MNKFNQMLNLSKNSILSIAILLLCFFTSQSVSAQKIGHLNFQNIIELMPQYKVAETEYALYQQSLEDQVKEIENMALEIQAKYEAESKKPTPSKVKMQLYANQLQSYQEQYSVFQQGVQDSLKAKMAELVAPIREEVELAVAEVAKENGYTHILDNTYGTLIYADEAYNIFELVKTKLNIKEKPVANPGAGKTKTTTTPR